MEDSGLVFVEVVEGAEDGAEVGGVAVSGEVEAGLEVEFVDLSVELDSEEGHGRNGISFIIIMGSGWDRFIIYYCCVNNDYK